MATKKRVGRGRHRNKRGGKVEMTMHEFKHGKLHSGSKKGPLVKDRDQAIAIALDQARRNGERVAPRSGRKSSRGRRRSRRSSRK